MRTSPMRRVETDVLGSKQDQSASAGAVAIQAGGNVNYHGLSVAEVKELCGLFLKNNFPELREEAKRAAQQHVESFAAGLEAKLVNDAATIVLNKFAEPDVQATINDAVQASARKGQGASPQILASLISERVSIGASDYKDIVLSEAVKVVPRLTAQQIALISLVQFVKSMTISNQPAIGSLEPFGRVALAFSSPGFNLSDSQKQHIQYSGACSVNQLVGGDIFEALRSGSYAYFGVPDTPSFKSTLQSQAPSFYALLEQAHKENVFAINLTSVGQAIAIANISNYLGKMDYGIWLK
jgi:hypothetical protein